MNKEEQIAHLEAEILAARETIKGLIKAIEELSKDRVGPNYVPYPVYVQPYRWAQPYWTYTSGGVTYTSTVGNINTATSTQYTINKPDEGDEGVAVAV